MQPTRLNLIGITLVMAAAIMVSASGCVPRNIMVAAFVDMVQDGLPVIEQEQDLQLLANALPSQIKLMESLLSSDPDNRELLILLARLYGGYAFAVLETEFEARHWGQPSVLEVAYTEEKLEDAIASYFQRGAQFALQALEIDYPQAQLQLQKPQSTDRFMDALTLEDVPALFWYGFNLGGYSQHRLDSILVMANVYQVEKAMQRVTVLDPGYYHGSAHLALLAYYASRSPMTGGNPALAEVQFKRHQLLSSEASDLRQLYWARYVLVQRQEKEKYIKTLGQVAQALKPGESEGLLSSVAAARAKIYLGAIDQFFD